jgi:hypothetical protein
MRVRTRNEKRISDAKRDGNSIDVDRVTREAKADAANIEQLRRREPPPRYGFTYKVSLRNTGAKAVKSLDWDHVFSTPTRRPRRAGINSPATKRSPPANRKS